MQLVARICVLLFILGFSAATDARVSAEPRYGTPGPVILITLDGVRWQEIFEGEDPARTGALPPRTARELLPNLYEMVRQGGALAGAPGQEPMRVSGPNFVSLPGYLELFSGAEADGCTNNDCPRTTSATLLDRADARGLRTAAFASWPVVSRALSARTDANISAGLEAGSSIDPYPGLAGFRPDRLTAEKALSALMERRLDFLYVGFGETDEYAHRGDYAGYIQALRFADAFVGEVRRYLAQADASNPGWGRSAHIIVTTDHGRAADFRNHGGGAPESQRTWLAAAGPQFRGGDFSRTSEPMYLRDVRPVIEDLLGLRRRGTSDGALAAGLFATPARWGIGTGARSSRRSSAAVTSGR